MSEPDKPAPQPIQASFKLEDVPRPLPAIPDHVREQIQAIKARDDRIGPAMESIEPEGTNSIDTTVFESDSMKISAIGKVAGLNVKGRF